MDYAKRNIALICILFFIMVIGLILKEKAQQETTNILINNIITPTSISNHSQTLVYNPQGLLSYQIMADKSIYDSNNKVNWFTNLVMIIYNEKKLPAWIIKSNQAKLEKEKILYLYGNVIVDSLTEMTTLKHLKTEKAQVNLITQDWVSQEKVTLSGHRFFSTGMKMYGNLRNKTAQLTGIVRTTYGTSSQKTDKKNPNNQSASGLQQTRSRY
ncbi:LPS export ABC transporter periplasmic protein LptC [Candidatus Erwinia haradaeae]|uniref:Lipopolysaccharide export system protein LptC n=1 Tax=Candidatus Erwinia haradaeae TaxID=1922217 RepID=A0A803FUM4_9GAMM|nr:LPS export ABC transporter periplasmic protein LptC [Candidatus Erwinia haradaeae]VFP88852.1 Lipopolysaccharide export system protein LptC [Candidatus Erwinia haradaeae]